MTRGFKYGLYVQATQDMANDAIQNIGLMLQSPRVTHHYPGLGNVKKGKHGESKGWRRDRVWSDDLVMDGAGLDTATRGLNLDDQRPDFIIFDDIDGRHDSLKTTQKKLETIKDSILPAGAPNATVMVLQNLITPHGVVTRLADANPDYPADFLMDRFVSGPHPAIIGLEYEQRGMNEHGRPLYAITAGVSTWPEARPIRPTLEAELNQFSPSSFIREKQNEISSMEGTLYAAFALKAVPRPDLELLEDIVVVCDPAVTSTDNSDSNGVRVGGRFMSRPADHSPMPRPSPTPDGIPWGAVIGLYAWEGRDTVDGMLTRALVKAVEYGASRVVLETNQGGDTWITAYNATWRELVESADHPSITPDTPKPRMEQMKASVATGGKRERWQVALSARERGDFLEAEGTHEVIFSALRRLPEVKPYDIADADYWLYAALSGQAPRQATTLRSPSAAINTGLIGGQKKAQFRR
ncbi:hypothetical protein [Deinococcus arenicola]|uniref:Terminase large subunit gp17-like C-terminal domain-containing protein n=1 Tax=Deinococcus arenicola TaxID=2994950 RepID=A0ABU4DUW7_9DEIO|nr:hypothetical protein [Deinococcus sp. ZS9-10]MDV6376236.1 hypothetical protein [Deinococcus sp. ZS9-10]